MSAAARLILFHTQATSGRTRFLRFATGLLAFEGLPAQATLCTAPSPLRLHPAALLREAEQRLGLAGGGLEAETGFHAELVAAAGPLPVVLARFTAIDPPFAAAATVGAHFVSLTEVRGLPAVEMQLARLAYETILG